MFGLFIYTVVKVLIIVIPLMLTVAYFTYAERKIIGFMQLRIGPHRVGPYGLLQPIADAVKLLFKEIIFPDKADKFLFILAPALTIAPSLAAWSVVPFGEDVLLTKLNVGVLFVFTMTSLSVYGIILAGWSSNSKYAFFGAIRAMAQTISYEIVMGFALIGVVLASGTMELTNIVVEQRGGFLHWYWLPLFPLFIVFWIASVAETNRAPFDVAEGESEIVAGFHVDYSGMSFAVFFLAEYANMILVSVMLSLFFLGGWLSPFEGIYFFERVFSFVPPFFWLVLKTLFFMFSLLWFRATFPRYRYDQIMRLCWKILIPVTLVWIFVLAFAVRFEVWPWFTNV